MNEALDRAAMAAFWHWRRIPRAPEAEIVAVWGTLPDSIKEAWLETARAVLGAVREPTADMLKAEMCLGGYVWGDDVASADPKEIWRAMIDEALK